MASLELLKNIIGISETSTIDQFRSLSSLNLLKIATSLSFDVFLQISLKLWHLSLLIVSKCCKSSWIWGKKHFRGEAVLVEGLIIISQESYFETTPTGSKYHPGEGKYICINIVPQNKYMYFVEICFGRVTHYYLRLAESYLEERGPTGSKYQTEAHRRNIHTRGSWNILISKIQIQNIHTRGYMKYFAPCNKS